MLVDFYFSGVSIDKEFEYLLENNGCILLSQLNQRSDINKLIEKIKELNSRCKLFIDSGSFSAWTRGVSINIDDYISFINQNKEYFTVCASVDSIPGKPKSSTLASEEEVEESANKTWDNFLYMRSKMDNPDILLCTFHCGESYDHLKTILDYEDDKGKIKYLGLGGMVGKSDAIQKSFMNKCFEFIKNSNNPNIKIHAFGMTKYDYLLNFPFTSADSTTWLMTASYGNIIINTRVVYVSNQNDLGNDHINNRSQWLRDDLKSLAEKYGFTLEELMDDYQARRLFNLKSLKTWIDSQNQINRPIFKKSLF